MKQFFSDWRHSALIGAGLIILLLLFFLIGAGTGTSQAKVVRIGTRVFTDAEVLGRLKRMAGDQVVEKLVDQAVVENYAADKHITVTDQEVEQVLSFDRMQLEMRGQTIEELLESKGQESGQYTSLDDIKRDIRAMLLQIKLVVPQDDIQKALPELAKQSPLFDLPVRYQIREFTFLESQSKEAKEALAKLQKDPKALDEVAGMTLSAKEATKVKLYIPGVGEDVPGRAAAIKALTRPNSISKLVTFTFPAQEGRPAGPKLIQFYQVVDVLAAEKGTVENRGMLVGQFLLQREQKYQVSLREIIGKAWAKADVGFYTSDYARAQKMVRERKQQNPETPGLTGDMSAPPTGQPAIPTLPTPRPPAGGR